MMDAAIKARLEWRARGGQQAHGSKRRQRRRSGGGGGKEPSKTLALEALPRAPQPISRTCATPARPGAPQHAPAWWATAG